MGKSKNNEGERKPRTRLRVLSGKEKKGILKKLAAQWGFESKIDYVFILSGKQRLFVATKDLFSLDLARFRINSIGLYFGEQKNDLLRLSIDGSQIVGPGATKNIVALDARETIAWLQGSDIEKKGDWDGFVLLKSDNAFIGCGKYKDGKILNFVPKARRLPIRFGINKK